MALLSSPYLHPKIGIAVDDDIDPHNAQSVMYALSTRVNPKSDVFVIPDTLCRTVPNRSGKRAIRERCGCARGEPADSGACLQPRRLKPQDVPKSWEDVTNSRYKGIVALDDAMRAGPLSSMLAAFKDEWKDDARWANFIRGLKALNVPVHRSTSAMFRLLVAGEYSIVMPALFHDLVHEKEIGSPVDFVKGAAPVVSPQQAAIYRKAPHPSAARLFAEWLVSPNGQSAIDAVGRPSARRGFKSKTSMENGWGPDVKPIVVENKAYIEDARNWVDTAVKPVWAN